jgi:hypothetical protein
MAGVSVQNGAHRGDDISLSMYVVLNCQMVRIMGKIKIQE